MVIDLSIARPKGNAVTALIFGGGYGSGRPRFILRDRQEGPNSRGWRFMLVAGLPDRA